MTSRLFLLISLTGVLSSKQECLRKQDLIVETECVSKASLTYSELDVQLDVLSK